MVQMSSYSHKAQSIWITSSHSGYKPNPKQTKYFQKVFSLENDAFHKYVFVVIENVKTIMHFHALMSVKNICMSLNKINLHVNKSIMA